MAWLAALGGSGAAGAAGAGAAGAEAAGAAGAGAGAGAGSAGAAGTAGTAANAATGILGQPNWAMQSIVNTGLNGLMNQKGSALPSPTPQTMTPMTMPSPLSPQPMTGGGDMSAYAPFLQALARGQQSRFGATPFGFGVPSGFGQ